MKQVIWTIRNTFWYCGSSWDTYPFRIVWIGFWMISYDRSGQWYERWPHVSISWNAP